MSSRECSIHFLISMAMLAVLISLCLVLSGCGTAQLSNAINPPVIYQLDLKGALDGYSWQGVAIGSDARSHTIQIESPTDVNYMRIISCHRFESYPDVIKTGWFKANRGFQYIYNESSGIEDTGICVLRLQAFTKEVKSDGSPVGSAYALMLFHNKKFTLPATNICNGAEGQANGTSICQSMNGLLQRLRFKTQVMAGGPPPEGSNTPQPCVGNFIDANTWEYKMPQGECVTVFMSTEKPHQFYIHLSYGFTKDQYRGG